MRSSCRAFLLLVLAGCGNERESTTPDVGPITASVYASGHVKAADQYTVYSVASGVLQEAMVRAGDTVKAGDVLFRIDDRSAGLLQENARLALELAEKNAGARSPQLKEREEAVRLAREKLTIDSLNWMRQKSLWEQHIGSQAEMEQRELAYRSARTGYLDAVSGLDDARNRASSDRERARNDLARSGVAHGDFLVRSLLDGRVYDVRIEAGELVSPQVPLAVVGRMDEFLMELEVDEFDIARIATGQEVLVTLDSQGDRVFKAKVTRIDPIMDPRSRTFTIEARFTDAPPVLYPNLTVEANVVTGTEPHALTIPAPWLVDGRYVLVKGGERREVQVGLRDAERVQILGGIDSTTVILKP